MYFFFSFPKLKTIFHLAHEAPECRRYSTPQCFSLPGSRFLLCKVTRFQYRQSPISLYKWMLWF